MITYIPFKDLTFRWHDSNSLTLCLPWLKMELEIDQEEKSWIQVAMENLVDQPRHPLTQQFLKNLKEYPLSYLAPRKILESSETFLPAHNNFSEDDLTTPHTFVQDINGTLYNTVKDALPEKWHWSLEDLLENTRIAGTDTYDPLSVVTYLIGKRLAIESQTGALRTDLPHKLDTLRQKDEHNFFEKVESIIRQTQYVTHHFNSCAAAAYQSFPQAKALIKKYISEEEGHENFMIHSLKSLGCKDLTPPEPLAEIALILQIFKESSALSALAFTLLISHFEGSSITATDPLEEVLKKSSKPKAAKGFAAHHRININAVHTEVVFGFAKALPLLYAPEVRYAARILELCATLGGMSDRKLHASI